jgi:cytochrome c-type biogenesis protein CcmE
MNALHQRRLTLLIFFVAGIALAASFILYSLNQNINVFVTPTQLATSKPSSEYHLRLGGVVKNNSVHRDPNNTNVSFIVTDFKNETVVYYTGILPDLFREGKGVIAEGVLNAKHQLIASAVLAKHDENYMPPNIKSLTNPTAR